MSNNQEAIDIKTEEIIGKIVETINSGTTTVRAESIVPLRKYVTDCVSLGVYESWFTDKGIVKEATRYREMPDESNIRGIKQTLEGTYNNVLYEVKFKLTAHAKHYYEGIKKKNLDDFVNNSVLTFLEVGKYSFDTDTFTNIHEYGEEVMHEELPIMIKKPKRTGKKIGIKF